MVMGIWVAAVTAGAAYVSAGIMSAPPAPDNGESLPQLEQLSTEMTSVPVIRNGAVSGYIIIQLNFAVNKEAKEQSHADPTPFLIDAAFRAVYQNPQADFQRLRASDIDKLTEAVKAEANKRLPGNMVHEVLIQQLNFVRKEDIRTNWVKDNH